MVRSLVWKEFHWLRPLVLAALVGFLPGLLALILRAQSGELVLSAIFFVPIAVSLGGAVLVYCRETDERTDGFLRQLGVPPGALWLCKTGAVTAATVLSVVVSAVLFVAADAVWSDGSLLASRLSQPATVRVLAFWCLFLVSLVLWGSLFAKLVRHAIAAAVLGAAASLAAAFAAANLLLGNAMSFGEAAEYPDIFGRVFAVCTALVGVLAVSDCLLTAYWLEGRERRAGVRLSSLAEEWRRVLRRRLSGLAPALVRSQSWPDDLGRASPAGRLRRRLLTLEIRRAWWVAPLAVIAGVFATQAVVQSFRPNPLAQPSDLSGLWSRFYSLRVWLLCLPAVLGAASCCGAWRDGEFAFLGERGVSPGAVWRYRQAVWFPLAL
ncbi:MAG: hypothetical protein D6725_18375, partial [Planctomycetota bacterium]